LPTGAPVIIQLKKKGNLKALLQSIANNYNNLVKFMCFDRLEELV